jgi:hypothetical protein
MEPLPPSKLDVNDLVGAVEAEAEFKRFWLPPEPWWDAIVLDKQRFAAAAHRHLLRGGSWPRAEVVDVRKPGHGIRPVSVMSPEVRVVYRAIVSRLIRPGDRVDRSAEKYAEFVMGPIRSAFGDQPGIHQLGDANYSHILVADIAAFYQYIDHAILRDELDASGFDVDLIDTLVSFLSEIEGRRFGIPQMSEPSDWISEIYASRLERWLIRDGFAVWRYSDDFRVACASYSEALRAIESLSRAARELGLVLNEQKTAVPSFFTYLAHNANIMLDDVSAEIDPSDVEAAISADYFEDEGEALADAYGTIDRLWDPADHAFALGEFEWNLRTLTPDEHRAVRRALNTLSAQEDSRALPRLLSILTYQPAMTHRVVRYAEAISQTEGPAIEGFLDAVISRVSLNEWQRAWIAYGFRACRIVVNESSDRATWLNRQLADRPTSLSASEAAVTLAEAGLVNFSTLESRLRMVGEDFAPWYLHSIALLHLEGMVSTGQIGALRASSAAASAILK